MPDGLYVVQQDGKFGLVDKAGKVICDAGKDAKPAMGTAMDQGAGAPAGHAERSEHAVAADNFEGSDPARIESAR